MSQTEVSSRSQGILNREWAVRPAGSNSDATPEDATVRTIFFCDLRWVTIQFQRNVSPVPPYPETKKKPGSSFVTLLTIELKAAIWSSLSDDSKSD